MNTIDSVALANEGEVHYSPYDYAVHEDPYPFYARLRAEAPVYHNAELGFWAFSRHVDVEDGFRDNETFSSANGVTLDKAASGPHAHRVMSFLAMDPPMHTRMRGLVSKGFTPRRVAQMEPQIREIAGRYLDAARDIDDFDIIRDFAGKMPMDVISEMMGVPKADRDEVRRWADLVVHREDGIDDVPPAGIEAAMSLVEYYTNMIAIRREHPTDDLTSALLAAEVDGDRLADDDVIAFLFLMVIAGNETTTKLLGHCLYWLWRNPGELAKVWDGTNTVVDWVEETLRYDTSTQLLARTTTTDFELHGQRIPAGDRVVFLVGSANRDENVFENPDEYRLGRDTSQIMSFGFGRHFCMGASLARLEARVALEEWLARFSGYEIDADRARRVHSVNVRGFDVLPASMTWRTASA
ncbi:MAG: cytochrome P450 [Microthrixaceae bacterium]|nr:cytochrome P450 [Microthrixaceae bacterium]